MSSSSTFPFLVELALGRTKSRSLPRFDKDKILILHRSLLVSTATSLERVRGQRRRRPPSPPLRRSLPLLRSSPSVQRWSKERSGALVLPFTTLLHAGPGISPLAGPSCTSKLKVRVGLLCFPPRFLDIRANQGPLFVFLSPLLCRSGSCGRPHMGRVVGTSPVFEAQRGRVLRSLAKLKRPCESLSVLSSFISLSRAPDASLPNLAQLRSWQR